MNFGLWVSSGLLKFQVFEIQNKNSYTCKKVMQVLTGQYPSLYTHKVAIDYTDFQPSALKYGLIDFLTIPKGFQVVFVQTKNITAFSAVGVSTAFIRVHQKGFAPTSDNATGQFAVANVLVSPSSTQGSNFWQTLRRNPLAVGNPFIICSYDTPTTLQASLNITGTSSINDLTAGKLWVWVTVMRVS